MSTADSWLTDDVVNDVAEYGGLVIAASQLIYNIYTRDFSPFALLGGVLLGVVWWLALPILKCIIVDKHDWKVCVGGALVDKADSTANDIFKATGYDNGSEWFWNKITGGNKSTGSAELDALNAERQHHLYQCGLAHPLKGSIAALEGKTLEKEAPTWSGPDCAWLKTHPKIPHLKETDEELSKYGMWTVQQLVDCRLHNKCVVTDGAKQAQTVLDYDSADVISQLRKDPAYQPEYTAWFNKYLSYDKKTIPAFADSKQCAAAPDVRSCYIKTRAQEDAYYARLNLSDADAVKYAAGWLGSTLGI